MRNGRSEAKKKTYQRKRVNARSRRGASVSSMSSDSLSCSTCRGGSSGSWESECDRPRGRSEGREKDKRNSRRSDGRSKSGYRSRSRSSCSGCSNQCSYEDDRWMGENSSRRLKSVLNVTTQSKEMEEKERNWDENRVEIIQAYDDCPSSRSNDSCDGGRKKESAYHPHIVPEKKRRIDDANREDTYISKIRNTETGGSSKEDSRAQNDIRGPTLPMVGSTKDLTVNKNEFSAGTDITKGDDLESLLRLKALENLRKFRRVLHNNKKAPQKDEIAIEGKQSPITKADSTQNESHKADCGRLLGAGKVVASVSIPPVDRKSISPQNDGQVSDDSFKGHKSNAKLDPVCPAPNNCSPGQTVFGGKVTQMNNMIVGAINNKSAAPGNITFRQGTSGGKSILKPTSTSEESPRGKLPEIKDSADKSAAETSKTVPESGNILKDVNKDSALSAPGTCLSSTTEEHGLNEARDEVKEGSQFEKKTMSVMRGGEMVQVGSLSFLSLSHTHTHTY
uniref:Uncharacterized protein n=1 Tax=Nelumbo nucifera TaxID=4432 RepID=A0A822XVK7_NELNU|nr:TPA_asm: hypothetical protein HUJ06_024278 [Nelumbo nucifera]